MESYDSVYYLARKRLHEAGVVASALEARLIVAFATGKTREDLISSGKKLLTDLKIRKAIDEMVSRRIEGEPVAYIVGEWEFYGIPLIISKAVLIPRVDTEILTAEAIRLLRQLGRKTRLLDLCAGSGCIGLAVAANVPDCRVVFADNSESALAVCRANMLKSRLSKMGIAVRTDALANPPEILGEFDMIVCNPPYIPTADICKLDKSVTDYEPLSALDGGAEGTDFFKAVARNWRDVLTEGGHLAFECGAGQAESLCEIMNDCGYTGVCTFPDTLNIERVVIGTKNM